MCVYYIVFYTDYKKNIYEDYYCYTDGNYFKVKADLKIKTSE